MHLPASPTLNENEVLNKMADKRFIPTNKWNYDLPVNFITYG